ncbi:hypothetical protein DFH06DRAFT_1129540 [Mycena polygramma]|nr:hypothetical protein DFH06DRAFT_1145757 [Mycena polygramma]KAJ7661442.1 hypothetical protein DFH06DRAFT_1129540 [Mycena polygramma]
MRNQHLDTSHCSCTAPRTEENKTRRRADLPMDVYLDFDKPMLGLVWAKDNETAAQVSLYPREDMRIRLSDHKVALAEVGLEQGNGNISIYAENVEHPGSRCWYKCTWDTPLRVQRTGDVIMICYNGIPRLKDFQTLATFALM